MAQPSDTYPDDYIVKPPDGSGGLWGRAKRICAGDTELFRECPDCGVWHGQGKRMFLQQHGVSKDGTRKCVLRVQQPEGAGQDTAQYCAAAAAAAATSGSTAAAQHASSHLAVQAMEAAGGFDLSQQHGSQGECGTQRMPICMPQPVAAAAGAHVQLTGLACWDTYRHELLGPCNGMRSHVDPSVHASGVVSDSGV